MKLIYKSFVLPIMFLFLMCTIGVAGNRDLVNISSVEYCVGEVNIKVEPSYDIEVGEYVLQGCSEMEINFWQCTCNNPTSIVFESNAKVRNEFDFIIEYYVEELQLSDGNETNPGQADIINEGNKRTVEINNIQINPPKVKLPAFNLDNQVLVIIVVVIGLIVVIGLLIFVGIWIFKSEKYGDEKKEKPKEEVIDIKPDVTDEEVESVLNSLK